MPTYQFDGTPFTTIMVNGREVNSDYLNADGSYKDEALEQILEKFDKTLERIASENREKQQ